MFSRKAAKTQRKTQRRFDRLCVSKNTDASRDACGPVLDVQIFYIKGVGFDKAAAGFDLVAH